MGGNVSMVGLRSIVLVLMIGYVGTACGRADGAAGRSRSGTEADASTFEIPPYTGVDAHGIPHYAHRAFAPAERELLLHVYGIEDPDQLYVSDSSDAGLLKYDSKVKQCRQCYVNSYRVGFVSIRRSGESWDAVERRVRAMRPSDFPSSARVATTSIAAMDPAIRGDVERMLADAQGAGFHVRVIDTYRSPEREAFLMAQGKGRTYTLTSMHSYGRAIDIMVDDGKISRRATRQHWIAFRRWVVAYGRGEYRLLGTPESTWDWPHVEIPSPDVGFPSIEAALARAQACSTGSPATSACDFAPHLPSGEPGDSATGLR